MDLNSNSPKRRSWIWKFERLIFVILCVIVLVVLPSFVIHQERDYNAAVAPFEALVGHSNVASGARMSVIRGRWAVESLYLTHPDIDDDAIELVMEDFKRLPNLKYLLLKGSDVSELGRERLRRELPHLRFSQ